MQAKESERDALSPLFSHLTSDLPSENSDCVGLQSKLDSIASSWEDLTQQLAHQQTCLENALGLANVTEGALGKLNPWVPDTLSYLKSLGPPPAEPELVQKQKAELEVSPELSFCMFFFFFLTLPRLLSIEVNEYKLVLTNEALLLYVCGRV